ncbi:MAG: PP2C family protein-serine/threonine phosphatase [Xanthomonadales bacterium]|nr:PP2C family protein-serine/threonine phosphatase [Xanthomonadales bacterium]
MELIASLREQLDRLCTEPEGDPNWMLERLGSGLRERYGRVAVGFVRIGRRQAYLLGLCDAEGKLLVQIAEDFKPGPQHPTASIWTPRTEVWFPADQLPAWSDPAIEECLGETQAAFLTPWLVDRPDDWMILVLSPIAAPQGGDRGLAVTANLLATSLLRALDARRLAQANAWIDREMDEIARLQRLLQPDEDLELGGVDIAFCSHFYQYAGGDYFDIPRLTHLIPEDQRAADADFWGVMIADVAGHGPSAAVEAAMLDAISRTYAGPVADGPECVVEYINRHMFTRRPRASYVTAFLGDYRPTDRILSYANAGHLPPLIGTPEDGFQDLPVPGDIPLRIERDYRWKRAERHMEPGDVLILFTDGVTECRSPDGKELGREGFRELANAAHGDAGQIAEHLKAGISRHRAGRPPKDDQTIIVIRFL